MATFAEINIANQVIRVVKGCTQDAVSNGGEGSEEAATHFATVCPLSDEGVKWVQTFFSGSQRKRPAGIGGYYNPDLDMFIYPQPYDSWTLDNNGDWKAPVTHPSIGYEELIGNGSDYRVLGLLWNEETKNGYVKIEIKITTNGILNPYLGWQ